MSKVASKIPYTILNYALVVYFFGFVTLLVFSLLNFFNLSILFGWTLGAVISSINYGTIIFQSKRIQQRVEAQIKSPYVSQGYALARLILSGLGMLICVLVKPNNVEMFNLFSLFASYLVFSLIIYLTGAQYKMFSK